MQVMISTQSSETRNDAFGFHVAYGILGCPSFKTLSINLLRSTRRPQSISLSRQTFNSSHNFQAPKKSKNRKIMTRWNAFEVLQIKNTSACAGYEYSQRRPCSTHFTFANTRSAKNLLGRIQKCALSRDLAWCGCLEALARFLLCTLHYEHQSEFLIETWKRRVLWFQSAQMMQGIQTLESRVGDIEVMLGQSSLSVARSHSSHGALRSDALDEHETAQPQERYAMPSIAASSSTRQPFSTPRADNPVLSDLALDSAGNLDQLDGPRSDANSSFFYDVSHPPYPPVRHMEESNPQTHTNDVAKSECAVCLDAIKTRDPVRRCCGCLGLFHEDCIHLWIQQCRKLGRNGTCPCW